MAAQVEPRVRFERSEQLRILSSKKRIAFQRQFLDLTKDVLVEDRTAEGNWTGLTSEYIRVNFRSYLDLANRIVPVRISELEGEHCTGNIIDTSSSPIHVLPTTTDEVSVCA